MHDSSQVSPWELGWGQFFQEDTIYLVKEIACIFTSDNSGNKDNRGSSLNKWASNPHHKNMIAFREFTKFRTGYMYFGLSHRHKIASKTM